MILVPKWHKGTLEPWKNTKKENTETLTAVTGAAWAYSEITAEARRDTTKNPSRPHTHTEFHIWSHSCCPTGGKKERVRQWPKSFIRFGSTMRFALNSSPIIIQHINSEQPQKKKHELCVSMATMLQTIASHFICAGKDRTGRTFRDPVIAQLVSLLYVSDRTSTCFSPGGPNSPVVFQVHFPKKKNPEISTTLSLSSTFRISQKRVREEAIVMSMKQRNLVIRVAHLSHIILR